MGGNSRENLVRYAKDPKSVSRDELARSVGCLILNDDSELAETERLTVYHILRHILHDLEMSQRRAVSERLAPRDDIPAELVRTLANEDIEIAYPILVHSPLLADEDLIRLIHDCTVQHRLAICERETIGETVSDALLEQGEELVTLRLLDNEGARLSGDSMIRIVDQSKSIPSYQAPLLRRDDLPKALIAEMYTWVSASLRQYIMTHSDIPAVELDALLVDQALNEFSTAGPLSQGGAGPTLADARRDGVERPTAEDLIAALRGDEYNTFIGMMSALTGLSDGLLMRIVLDQDPRGMAITCKTAGIDKASFTMILAQVSRMYAPDEESLSSSLNQGTAYFDRLADESAWRAVAEWKSSGDYRRVIDSIRLS